MLSKLTYNITLLEIYTYVVIPDRGSGHVHIQLGAGSFFKPMTDVQLVR